MSSQAKDDDPPDTPRNTTPAPSRDTERDLAPLTRDSDGRVTEPDKTPSSTTLLSMKAQLAREERARDEREREDRSDELERRITQLEARIKVLELQRGAGVPADRRWMIWVALLAALALGWQLRAFFR